MGKKKKKVDVDPSFPVFPSLSLQEKEELACRIEKKRGNEYYKQDSFESAIVCYSKAIVLSPKNPELLVSLLTNRAISYLRAKQYKLCVEDCTSALSIDDTHVNALICRAFGHFYLQNYDSAIQDYETAHRLQPGNQSLQKNIQKAKEILLQRVKQDPPSKNKKTPEVQWVGDFGLNIDEEFIPPNLLKPLLTSKGKGADEKSGKEADDPKKAQPRGEPPLLIPIGEVLPRNALLHIPESKREAEQIAIQEKELGNKAFQAGDFLVALTHYSKAIKLNPEDSVFFANRALVYLKIARYYESITDSSASIDRKPNIKAYARRASAWSFLKEYEAASDDYKKALAFEPMNKDCLCELEVCLKQLLKEYTTKLQSDPSNGKLKKLIKSTQEDIDKVASAKAESKVAAGPSTPLQKH